jgi:hypothetical protein
MGSAGLECFHQIGGFSRHVEASCDAEASEWLFPLKPFLDESQHRHGGFGPFDLELTLVC